MKMICELRQQTPMLHFQPDETGACLRGTEVKPKLDRFIRKILAENSEQIPDHWFLETNEKSRAKKNNYALNYKIRFQTSGVAEIRDGRSGEQRINRSYFGNQGQNVENKKTVFYDNRVKMTILCFIPDLLEVLQDHLEAFFVLHNFGTRQTKGFGSFTLVKVGNNELPFENRNYVDLIKKYVPYGLFFEYNSISCAKSFVMEDIRMIYGLMKGGFNYTNINLKSREDYFKGYIFRYFAKKYPQYMNDKKFIKTHMEFRNESTGKVEKISGDSDEGEGIFCRALLGLPPWYEYRHLYSGKVTVSDINEETDNQSGEGEAIRRFPSPVLWTVAGKYLLALPAEKDMKEILNRTFCFRDNYGNVCQISTPETFDFKDFLTSFADDFNDKNTPKGGRIGLGEAGNRAFSRIKEKKMILHTF